MNAKTLIAVSALLGGLFFLYGGIFWSALSIIIFLVSVSHWPVFVNRSSKKVEADDPPKSEPSWANVGGKNHVFLVCVFSMLAKLSKADGRITEGELRVVENFIDRELSLHPERREHVMSLFRAGINSSKNFEDYAVDYFQEFRSNPVMLVNLIDILLQLASADRRITEHEERLLSAAALYFGLTEARYESLRALYVRGSRPDTENDWSAYHQARTKQKREYRKDSKREGSDRRRFFGSIDLHYSVLACTPDSSDQEIKKSYRTLVHEHHPDRAIAQGLPEEFIKLATRRFQEIQEAYEEIGKERGWP